MSALSQDGVIDDTNIASTELDRVYQPLREQITSSVHRQESVLANIQVIRVMRRWRAGVTREGEVNVLDAVCVIIVTRSVAFSVV